MTKRMLIDATHEEETRVVVMDDDRLVEFDYESKYRKPLKGSIFLAKVTRVEPSLQAAFVNFGGNRHGFLPFSEIHPDYFRIPIADREALMAEQEAALEALEKQEEQEDEKFRDLQLDDHAEGPADSSPDHDHATEDHLDDHDQDHHDASEDLEEEESIGNRAVEEEHLPEDEIEDANDSAGNVAQEDSEGSQDGQNDDGSRGGGRHNGRRGRRGGRGRHGGRQNFRGKRTEKYDDGDDDGNKNFRFSLRRKYKIQEVIKRGQIMLVQVSKEERGNKGAAVTSYLSLPGRYAVLMPNSPRAGGVSRKISSYKDRARMRELMKELSLPPGMSVIMRTAGLERTKAEIKRDLDYLMRLWNNIREVTLESSAPAMVYEEADLIKRAVRDLYARDIEEIVVSGEEGYKTAKNFMKMMMPSHAKRITEYKDPDVPLLNKYRAETEIAKIGETQVTLPSGGYIVINPTEALVSVDVNSGKATKERHIEETALKTNLEAADEIARQLRLRDLGGLVVVDFIDMEDRRNNAKVERRMREAMASDRARTQMSRISIFGLMEISRQRISPSLTESQFVACPECAGTGRVRSADATSIMVLRAIEDEGIKRRAAQVMVHVSNAVALYILNYKRKNITTLEDRYGFEVLIRVDHTMGASNFRVEVSKPIARGDAAERDEDDEHQDQDRDQDEDDRVEDNHKADNRKPNQRSRQDNRERDDHESGPREHRDTESSGERPGRRRGRRGGRNRRGGKGRETQGSELERQGGQSQNKREDQTPDQDIKKEVARDHLEAIAPRADYESEAVPEKPSKKAPEKTDSAEDSANDDLRASPKAHEPKAYENVNAPPDNKKKGWWNRK